jgi:hypothetical protein
MISIEDRATFAKAEAKAREVKPRVKVLKYGEYGVESGQPDKDPYTVKFSKDTACHWQAECNCDGHLKSKTPKACYHIPPAYQAHKIQVSIRQQVRAAQAPTPVVERFCTCGAVATSSEGRCQACQAAKDNADLFG